MVTFKTASAFSPPCACNANGLLLQHEPMHTTHLRCLLKHFIQNSFTCPTCLQPVSLLKTFSNRKILIGCFTEGARATAENIDQAAKALLFGAVVYATISLGKYIL